MKIYVASSWRNEKQPMVVEALRNAGHEVYDFRNPKPGSSGFHWSDIDEHWKEWTPEQYRANLTHQVAVAGFLNDFEAMWWADVIIGVQPFGRSASMELGWGAGVGKETILLIEKGEPELMVKMVDHLCCSLEEVINALEEIESDWE